MTLSWLEIDQRWPGASVLWDRGVAGEGWDPVFMERDGVLWAGDPDAHRPNVTQSFMVHFDARSKLSTVTTSDLCRCRAWIPDCREWWAHQRWNKREDIASLHVDLKAGRFMAPIEWRREFMGEWVEPRASWRNAVRDHCMRLLEYRTAASNGLFDTFLSQYPEPRIINDRDVDRTARWIAYRIMQWEGRPNPNVLPI